MEELLEQHMDNNNKGDKPVLQNGDAFIINDMSASWLGDTPEQVCCFLDKFCISLFKC
jgi:hypothetical protein